MSEIICKIVCVHILDGGGKIFMDSQIGVWSKRVKNHHCRKYLNQKDADIIKWESEG